MLTWFQLKKIVMSGYREIYKSLILFFTIAATTIYLYLRVLLYDFPFNLLYELKALFSVVLVGAAFATIIFAVVVVFEFFAAAPKLLVKRVFYWIRKSPVPVILAIALLLQACQGQTRVGVIKDFNTGLTATYKNIEPEEVFLVMNDEKLGHNDIPIGESFMLINRNVKGLVEKDGKVSVGCSLVIADKNGKKLLDEADLFKGKDVLSKNEVNYLRATINTGEPMEWEEKYTVHVTFWDKFGTGKIENKVTIRAIDIP